MRSSQTHPCPVCGRSKDADCVIDQVESGFKVRCHTYIDQDPSIPGWVYKGATDCGTWGLFFERNEKHDRGSKKTEYIYTDADLEPVIKVLRVDKAGGKKECYQFSYVDGEWCKGLTTGIHQHIHLYRIFDAVNQQAKAEGKPILIVEGEGKADLLLSMGIAATSAVGGAGKWVRYGHKNYLKDLEGFQVVLCPDRDVPGIDHCNLIAKDIPDAKWLYAFPDSSLWDALPPKNGLDIADWIADYKLTPDQILGAIENEPREVKIFQAKEKELAPKKADSDYPKFTDLEPEDEVTNNTIDDHVFKRIFEGGKGDYMVLNSAFYKFTHEGYWAHIEDEEVEKAIATYTRSAYRAKRNDRNEIVDIKFPFAKTSNVQSCFNFSRTLLSSTTRQPYNRHLLCFRNCTVDLRTGELVEHDKGHYLTAAIAADYEPNQPCPDAFGEFVYSTFGEELLEVIQAVTSMLLDPTAPYGQFPHCIGSSGSGKGTMLRFWSEMYGPDNVRSAASLSELSTPEGRYQNLTGVSLFMCPDIGGYQQGLRAFYELVDNGPMSARPLFSKRNIQVQFNCRFAIASVDHLQIENSGDGWDRRAIPLPTKRRNGQRDQYLSTKLSEVKAQVISWALSISRERRDWILNNLHLYDRIETARGDASVAGDPTRSFVDMCLRPSPGNRQKLDPYKMHTWYSAYCHTFGYQRMGMNKFSNHLKTIIPAHHVPRKRATKEEDADRPIVPAHWIEIEALENVFQEMTTDGDVCKCIKKECREGGLWQFAEHANRVLNGVSGEFIVDQMDQEGSSTLTKGNKSLIRTKSSNGNSFISLDQADQADQGHFEQIKNLGGGKCKNGKIPRKREEIKKYLLNHPPFPDLPDPKFANLVPDRVLLGSGTIILFGKCLFVPDLPDPNFCQSKSFAYT